MPFVKMYAPDIHYCLLEYKKSIKIKCSKSVEYRLSCYFSRYDCNIIPSINNGEYEIFDNLPSFQIRMRPGKSMMVERILRAMDLGLYEASVDTTLLEEFIPTDTTNIIQEFLDTSILVNIE